MLIDVLKTANLPDNAKKDGRSPTSKLSEAKANSGKEMIKMMQYVFPLVMQLQITVIKEYGFPANREGLVQFEQIIQEFEREDVDIARLRSQVRSIYLQPININSTNDVLI
ncbi:protein C10-like [Toxorhynchites rutilus septentrionalis]|uniref:protein C10-like n=1 Tax=Toxorhynchites rutilus septentrionalis TaxID=329112 RepID=UPI0024792192|nr:protein C10-like [Toxorhynchites rutilus septentrionalis]